MSYYLNIGNFFNNKKIDVPKTKLGKIGFWAQFFFPDFGAQIGQQHFFIILQDGQTPHQSFFTHIIQNGPTGNQLNFGSKIEKKKPLIALCQNSNIVVQNLQTFFDNGAK